MSNGIARSPLFLAILLLTSTPLLAQTAEIGGTVALSVRDASDRATTYSGWRFGSAGAEVSLNVSDRYALFAQYNHWTSLSRSHSTTSGLKGADLVGGGLRIRGPELPGGVRPALDVGLGGGRYRVTRRGETRLAGYILGGSVLLPISDRWYVRPQMRVVLMGDKLCLQERLGRGDFPCAFGLGTTRSLVIQSWGVGFGVGL